MQDAGQDVARANIEAKFTEIADHTVSFLQPAESAARLTGRLVDSDILDLGSGESLESYFLGQLGEYGHFAGYSSAARMAPSSIRNATPDCRKPSSAPSHHRRGRIALGPPGLAGCRRRPDFGTP